jgi:ABC-type dipeptide/oligopeptide/nickel transport system permease component
METSKQDQKKKTIFIVIAVIMLLILAGMVFGIIALSRSGAENIETVRDIFIIVLAFESLLIGAALIILIIQLALLSNLIQNELAPILSSTKETVKTVKGTSKFISEKAIAPIVSAAGIVAGGKKLFELVGFIREKKKE